MRILLANIKRMSSGKNRGSVSRRWSLNNTDFSRLTFSKPQDALNCTSEIAKDGKNWSSPEDWNFSKGYCHGKLNVVVNCTFTSCSRNYDLVFSCIPDRMRSHYALRRSDA